MSLPHAKLIFLPVLHQLPARLQKLTSEGGPTLGAGEGGGCESSFVPKAMHDGSSCKEGESSYCVSLGIHHQDAEDLLNDTAVFLLRRVQALLF